MKTFYVLIDKKNHWHYGYTFDEKKAREEANRIEEEEGDGVHIDIYVFDDDSEF